MQPAEDPAPRAVVDANVVIRGLLSSAGASAVVFDAVRSRRVVLVGSRRYFEELHRTLARPRMVRRYGVTAARRRQLITRLYGLALHVELTGELVLCRDPHDDYLIEMALLAQAAYLITEDDDLLDDPAIVALLARHGTALTRAGDFARLHLR